jgi:hypothetical protein
MDTIFDNAPRASTEHKRVSQPIFDYLNNSARPGSEVTRGLIEDWFSRYPAAEQDELRSRFRSGDTPLAAAFHELSLHELLVRQGCKITLHPSVAGTTNRPDFAVEDPDGFQFLLEARTSMEVNSGPNYSPRYNRVLDFLRNTDFDGFLIGVCELTAGGSHVATRRIEQHIVSVLAVHCATDEAVIAIPPFEEDGWRIRLKAFRRTSYPNRTGLLYLDSSRTLTSPRYPLRSAVKDKAGRYGQDLPLVISVSSLDPMLTDCDLQCQLLGQGGISGSKGRPQLSAVLFTNNLWPATLLTGLVGSRLYLNPHAERPYRGVLEKLDTFSLKDDSWRCCPGKPLWELLELPRFDSSLWG